jgi:hypothetical protein
MMTVPRTVQKALKSEGGNKPIKDAANLRFMRTEMSEIYRPLCSANFDLPRP